jgi:hypothetical protein
MHKSVDKHLQLHGRHLLADFCDFFQGQFPRQDDPAYTLLLPELDTRPIDGIGLHRQMNRHLREVPPHQHDQTRIGHDQRVRCHGDHRCQILEEGLELGVMGRNVHHHIKALALGLCLLDAKGQVGVIEFVIAHPQAVARLAGVHRIGSVGEGITHVFQGAGGGEQFGGKGSHGNVSRKRLRA